MDELDMQKHFHDLHLHTNIGFITIVKPYINTSPNPWLPSSNLNLVLSIYVVQV